MKEIKTFLVLFLAFLMVGCTTISSPSRIIRNQDSKSISQFIEDSNLEEQVSLSDDNFLFYNLDLNTEKYNGIRIRLYSFEEGKWNTIYNQLWKLKSSNANILIADTKDDGLIFTLKSKNSIRTESILDTFIEKNNFVNDYDITDETEIEQNIPTALVACYRNYKDNNFKNANKNDLQNNSKIELGDSDEYYILTIMLT